MAGDTLLKKPVTERRGCWEEDCGNSWEAILLAGDSDQIADGLERIDEIGLVKRDVTEDVLQGNCPVPDGRWALLVKLAGTDWIHVADPTIHNPFTRDSNVAERLASASELRVLQTGYQKTAGATYVFLWQGTNKTIAFESMGLDFDESVSRDADEIDLEDLDEDDFDRLEMEMEKTRFASDRYDDTWWRQFSNEYEVQQALLRDLDAYVPFIQAYADDTEMIEVYACHEDVIAPEFIERIDLVVFGTASAEPNLASKQLREAIDNADASAVRTALDAGANLDALPGVTLPPLHYAISALKEERPELLEVIATLVDAGADVNQVNQRKGHTPLCAVVDRAQGFQILAFDVMELLINAGADVDLAGEIDPYSKLPALHIAVENRTLATVMFLHAHGVDPNATDFSGRTALECAEQLSVSLRKLDEQLGQAGRKAKPMERIAEYLRGMTQGRVVGDWREQAELDRAALHSERRRMQVAGAKFEQAMKEYGEQLDEIDAQTRHIQKDAVFSQPETITLQPEAEPSEWCDVAEREEATSALEELGFEHIGDFAIPELSGCSIRAFLHDKQNVYAAIGSAPMTATWIDLVRFHRDGSTLTVSNSSSADDTEDLFGDPTFQKIFLPDELAETLWDELLEDDEGQEVEELTAADFVRRFEEFYAADIAAKRAKFDSAESDGND